MKYEVVEQGVVTDLQCAVWLHFWPRRPCSKPYNSRDRGQLFL